MNSSKKYQYPQPPRLLLGATVMAWGGLTNHALVALGVAILIEGRHWLSWRWQFDLRGYSHAWILSLIALAGVVGIHSLNLSGPASLLTFLEWLPIIFLPLILAQQYGEAEAIPSSVFSVLARRRLKREKSLGKAIIESRIHLGYPYFTLTILATAFPADSMKQQWQFFAVMIFLPGIALYFFNLKEQRRVLPWLFGLIIIAGASMASSSGLITLYQWIKEGGFLSHQETKQKDEQNTAIGRLGDLKLSRRIKWRVYIPEGETPPERAMTYAYNNYRNGNWQAFDPNFQEFERTFNNLLTTVNKKDVGEFALDNESFQLNDDKNSSKKVFRLRGTIDSSRKAIPCPPSTALFSKAPENEINSMEKNDLGTILAINANNVIDVDIHTGSNPTLREAPPTQTIRKDKLYSTLALKLPADVQETNTIRSIVAGLGLNKLEDEEKIQNLKSFFTEHFTYTTHLKISKQKNQTALEDFLLKTREGHCEYFATATTLLLRASGVPAHYVVGFVVREEGTKPEEYLLRGTHAHAWCRAYIGGHKEIVEEEIEISENVTKKIKREIWTGGNWVDVDLTPPTWYASDFPEPTFKERIIDSLQRIREDFQLWRANEKNRGWVNLTLVLIGVTLLIFVIWRLSNSRVRKQKKELQNYNLSETIPTPLNLLIPKLEKQFGLKPPGQLLISWLTMILPEYSETKRNRLLILHDYLRFSSNTLESNESKEFENLIESLEQAYTQRKDR